MTVNRTVLIIDDSTKGQQRVADLLAHPGAWATCVAGGQDGVAKARERGFDCVLLALQPSGLDILAQLQTACPNLPVVILARSGSEQAASAAFLAGAMHYLPDQGLNTQTLHAAILEVIERAEARRAILSRRAAIERVNRLFALQQMAVDFAHDVNNQLGALRYCIELLRDGSGSAKDSERLQTALNILEQGAGSTARFERMFRPDGLQAQSVSLQGILAEVRVMAVASLSAHVALDVTTSRSDLSAYCDPDFLLVALVNLVENADEAIATTGRSGHIRVSAQQDGRKARIVVQDTGTGMSRKDLAQCCMPFFTTKTAANGAGFGLTFVQAFAQQFGGHLTVRSDKGAGTEVTLLLPQEVESKVPGKPPVPAATAQGGGARILVVEDQFLLASTTMEILNAAGFQAEAVRDGEGAMDMLQSGFRPDVILTDIELPGMSGLELAGQVSPQSPETEIIFVTGYGAGQGNSPQLLQGPVLQKPVNPDELVATIQGVLADRIADTQLTK